MFSFITIDHKLSDSYFFESVSRTYVPISLKVQICMSSLLIHLTHDLTMLQELIINEI
jgi:hypothetical protein